MGSNFVRYLHNKYPEYKIFNLDLLTYAGNPANLTDLADSERYHFIHGDIGDKSLVEYLLKQHAFEVVVNLAAESHVDRSIINTLEFIRTNIQGAYTLLEAIRLYKVPRFIFISTDEIYGDVPPGVHTPEDYPLQPTNPYAASKASADLLVQSYIKTHKVPALILRSSNNFGPFQYPEKLHALVVTNFLEGKKIPVHGHGRHLRSWIHVQDFCNALDLMMHQAEDFKIYNICGEEKSNLEVIQMIGAALGKNYEDHVEYVSDRPGPDFRYAPDCTNISKELAWKRNYHYKDSLEQLVNWYSSNAMWWHDIKQKQDFQQHYEKQRKGQYDL